MLSETDPLGGTTSYGYDALGRLTTLTRPDPDGSGSLTSPFTRYEYDAVGNLTAAEDALGQRTTYAYNALGWRTGVTDPNSDTTTFAFDDVGNMTSLTDPAGNATTWVYDRLDRPIEETNERLDSRYFAYDAAGNLTNRTDRNGRTTEYEYDNLHRRTEERWLDSSSSVTRTLSYAYDAASQLTIASDPSGAYSYTYDDLGRATEIAHDLAALSAVVTVAQAFDAASNRTQAAGKIGSNDDFVTDYAYDALHRMTGIEQEGASGGNAVAEKRIDLAYNAASQFDSVTRFADLAGTQLVATSSYGYDGTGRLTDLAHAKGSTTLADYHWSYDKGNRITQFVSLADGTVDYTYDARLQLTGADYDYQTDESYTYDENGNRTNTDYTTGTDNRLTSDGTYDYEYDDEGNRTKKTEIATGEATEYEWDHRNRLVKVVHLDSSANVLETIEYSYDIFDRRVGKTVTPAVGPAEMEAYVYDGEHVALRFENDSLANRYLHGPAIDQILADEQVDSLTSPGDVLWPLTDNLGTVRDLAEYDSGTDTTMVANHITYDAFGGITGETNAAVDHLFAYTGREWDADAELQYNRARWYDPTVGRWISQDPIGFAAGDANLYRYVGNKPTMAIEPSELRDPDTDEPWPRGPRLPRRGPLPRPPAEPITRPLTPGELEMLRDFFGDHLDTSGLRIGIGGLHPWVTDNSMTPRCTPWFPPGNYREDFSEASERARRHFIHEMAHVLQHQSGNWNWIDGPYLWVITGFEYDDAYPYDPLDLGRPLYEFNFEQQADIIADYYSGRFEGDELRRCEITLEGFQTQPPRPPRLPDYRIPIQPPVDILR